MPSRKDLLRLLGAALLVAAIAFGLDRWGWLQRSYWWYAESDAYQLWVGFLALLALLSFAWGPRRGLAAGWLLAIAGNLAGLVALGRYTVVEKTTGDLYQGYLAGAERLVRGGRIYDQRGLHQSVNATPLSLLLAVPLALGGASQREAALASVVVSGAALVAYVAVALARARRDAPVGIAELGLVLGTLAAWYSLQRSWRLGQLDTLLLALLALALFGVGSERRWARAVAAAAAAAATALKLLPAVVALPLAFRAASGAGEAGQRDVARRFLVHGALGGLLLLGVGLAAVGPDGCGDFVRNLPALSAGTTSGNSYALATRVATAGDRKRRATHQPLAADELWLQRGIAAATLVGLLLITRRLRGAPAELPMALHLAAVPLLTPACWDIYFVWCGLLPWLVLWLQLRRRWRDGARSGALKLQAVLAAGGYLLAGTAGNTAAHHLGSGVTVQLELPPWLDETPLVGHLLVTAVLCWVSLAAARDGRARRAADCAPPASA